MLILDLLNYSKSLLYINNDCKKQKSFVVIVYLIYMFYLFFIKQEVD